ncbi:MAG: hypothetical protein V1925_00145 [Candidatus Omnitrophota bacterium]
MDYTQFKNRFRHLPFILSKAVVKTEKRRGQNILNQLSRWQSRRLIFKLRRGIFILNENDRKITPSRYYLAGQLYAPSYISLESALSFYGLIPESVFDLTCVTTRKTIRFSNCLGRFIYQHIKPVGFSGYKLVKDENGLEFFMAEPEKAVVDFLYFNLPNLKKYARQKFKDSYRFQNLKGLSRKKIMDFAVNFTNPQLTELCRIFCGFIKLRG